MIVSYFLFFGSDNSKIMPETVHFSRPWKHLGQNLAWGLVIYAHV